MYPFGLEHKGYNSTISSNGNSTAQKIKFGGKEYQDELGLEWYDVSARNYDPALGRWMNLDPLAELMTRHSPYNYAFDNPIYFIDADGMMPIGMMSTGIDNPDFYPSEFDDRKKDFNPKDFFRPTVIANASGSNNNNGPSDPDPPVVYNGPGVAVGDNVVNLLPEVCIGCNSSSTSNSNNGSPSATDALEVVSGALDILEARQIHLSNTLTYKYATALESADEITAQARNWHRSVAKNAGRAGVGVQIITGSIDIYNGVQQDGGQFGQNAQRAIAGVAGGMAGAWAGAKAGAAVGAIFGPAGALIGGVIGIAVGQYVGENVGNSAVDYYYKD